MAPRSRTTRASPGRISRGSLPVRTSCRRGRRAQQVVEGHREARFKKNAKEKLEKAKLAKRFYDAKMRPRLEAGDELKRRKKTFGAARR
eukprot:6326761-Prymnesium_polylepis.1